MGKEINERRRFIRAQFPCKVIVYLPREHSFDTHTENISCGGVRIIIPEALNIGTVVGLQIFLSKKDTIKCKGKIVWQLPVNVPFQKEAVLYDMGLEFLDIREDDVNKITRLIKKMAD